jgi:bifunctional non-homologous end joining protein LigD
MSDKSAKEPLAAYRAKRSASQTPEPFGGSAPRPQGGALLFVIQKHAARRLHYDFRLELDGVLKSWAVPKGPSLDPAEKRLAVAVEDHPLEYANFEGTIPSGNYGAGGVIVWDRGSWQATEDPRRGLEAGKLVFALSGYKLHGLWTLVRTKRSKKDWLLIKKTDAWASADATPGPESVLSGLTLEDLVGGASGRERLRERLARLGVPRRRLRARDVKPMLAETREQPFSSKDWIFELKYDGFRLLVAREADEAVLRYRGGGDATAAFPEIARAVAALPLEWLVMDGEVVVPDEAGRPSFQRLQRRAQLTRALDVERAAVEFPATVQLFDVLALEGFDLRSLPLLERKALLREILPPAGALRFSDHVEDRGEALFAEVERRGLEGLVAKKKASPYRSGRSSDWLKVRCDRSGDFPVVGFTEPRGARSAIGALHVATRAGGGLRYAGRVGTGFDEATLARLRRRLDRARRDTCPCLGPAPNGREHVWVEPGLVCEVRYKEWTEEGLLRQPFFLRVRDDKSVGECTEERPAPRGPLAPADPRSGRSGRSDGSDRTIHFTNLDKTFWPKEGYTKGDLVEFYRGVSPWLLPYLRDRPLVLTRFPDGIEGKSFYQKDAPGFVPDWIRTERVWSEHAGREIDYFVCDDVDSLLYLANLGTIPLHLWSSRVGTLEKPDWCVLDLDPKGAPFEHVVRVALAIRRLCTAIRLPTFVKTSGSTGLHVLVPLGARCTYEQSRLLGELLSRVVVEELDEVATITRRVSDRGGKVYLDYLQNRHGQTIAAPFSVRPLPGAPVSTPLRWREVNDRLEPQKLTLRTLPSRLRRGWKDPMREVLTRKPDLGPALALLARRLDRAPHS